MYSMELQFQPLCVDKQASTQLSPPSQRDEAGMAIFQPADEC